LVVAALATSAIIRNAKRKANIIVFFILLPSYS
jgi:hypothetical protein